MEKRLRNLLFWIPILLGLVLSCSLDSGPSLTPGVLDPAFDPGGGPNGLVRTIGVQADKKILVAGDFTSFDSAGRGRVARLNADGSLDGTFTTGSGASFSVNTMCPLSGGKVLIGGAFSTYAGSAAPYLARLQADGTLDTTFNSGGAGPDGNVNCALIQGDGKILLAGAFSHYNGDSVGPVVRLNADGSRETSFSAPATVAAVFCMALQDDGNILVGGSKSTYNGLARLNKDGNTLDGSFNPGTGPDDTVNSISVQEDGKILIAGSFTSFNGTGRTRVARLNTDGSLDESFDPGAGANDTVNAVAVQETGKILLAGSFQSYDGTSAGRLARLNSDGTLDAVFQTGGGFNADTLCLCIQSDGMILLGGSFTEYDGTTVNRVARIAH